MVMGHVYVNKSLKCSRKVCSLHTQGSHNRCGIMEHIQNEPWAKRTLAKRTLAKQTLVKTNPGHMVPWSKRTLAKMNPGHKVPWS